VEQLLQKVEELNKKFDYLSNINEQMSEELNKYRQNIFDKEVISMSLDIIAIIGHLKEKNDEDTVQDLEDILYRHGIEPFSEEGNIVNTKTQKIIGYDETDDESLINTISKHCSCGYKKDLKVIKPEYVFIYKKRKEEKINE